MTITLLTNYDKQSENFIKLSEYSLHCGTDYLAVKDAPQIISRLSPLRKILDLGCGSGLATRYLKKHFPDAQVIGADINQSMLKKAAIADPEGVYLHLQQSNDHIIYPFLADDFDAVVCSFVVHENRTREELELFFKNIATLLRPEGLLLAWDVYKNLFQGTWLSIESLSPFNFAVEDGQPYTVNILPGNAEITGTYWGPETLSKIASSFNLQCTNIHYPLAEKNPNIDWLDETLLAPYFVLELKKSSQTN